MSRGIAVAVSPTANGDGTHPSLVLMSNGVIFPFNGAGSPLKSDNDTDTLHTPSGWSNWGQARFYSLANTGPTPTVGISDGEIARDIKVFSWANLADIRGHVLDGWGRVLPFGSGATTPKLTEEKQWGPGLLGGSGSYEARALRINAAGTAGYVLHMFGKPYRCGSVAAPLIPAGAFQDFSNSGGGGGYDFARDFVCNFVSSAVSEGIVLSDDGGLYKFAATTGSAWLNDTTNPREGSHFTGGWDIMRAIEFDFGTKLGYVMHGFGKIYACGIGAATLPTVGPYTDGFLVKGGPNKNGEDAYRDFIWPSSNTGTTTKFFVSLDNLGMATEWNQFINPALVYTSPATTLTNTSRPAITVTYGVGQSPAPAPMSDVAIWIYPLTVTQQTGFTEDQGAGAVFTYFRSGITGVNAGGPFSVTVADDLADAQTYKVYTKATSTEGVDSGWVTRQFTTAFAKPTTPIITGLAQPNNPGDPRNQINVTNTSGTFIYELSDDGGVTWDTLAGASLTTSQIVWDYDAPPKRARQYRVYKVTTAPYLKSTASNVVTLTMGLATGITGWRIKRPGVGGATVNLRVDTWAESLVQPQGKYYPAGNSKAVILTGGNKGDELHATFWCGSQAIKDALLDLLDDAQVLLLQNPTDQWYVAVGETVDFELQKTAPNVVVYKATCDLTEVLRPLV